MIFVEQELSHLKDALETKVLKYKVLTITDRFCFSSEDPLVLKTIDMLSQLKKDLWNDRKEQIISVDIRLPIDPLALCYNIYITKTVGEESVVEIKEMIKNIEG